MDSLRYFYTPQTNRLRQIQESVPANRYAVDIDNQSNTSNYTYDAIGNLIGDVAEGITNIEWSVYGKVLAVWKNGVKTLDFLYDGAGKRVRKRVNPGAPNEAATYYAYEAGGNVLAIYEGCTAEPREPVHNWDDLDGDGIPNESDPCPCDYANVCDPPPPPPDDPDFDGVPNQHDECPCESAPGTPDGCPPLCPTPLRLAEWHIYGSSAFGRFAVVKPEGVWRPEGAGQPVDTSVHHFTRILDEKYFELKDHLGNVRVVVTDVKKPAVQSRQHPYVAVIASYNNYYPYGMLQPERNWQAGGYRYGFNGKEMDNEVAVTGGSYDYGARMYDARVGRWWSTDPQAGKFPNHSTFLAFAANPVLFVDPSGGKVEVFPDPSRPGVTIVKVTGSIINLSSDPDEDLAEEIIESIKTEGAELLSGAVPGTDGEPQKIEFQFDLQVVTDVSQIREDDNLLVIADFEDKEKQKEEFAKRGVNATQANGISGLKGLVSYVDQNWTQGRNRTQWVDRAKVALHELCHQIFEAIDPMSMHVSNGAAGTILQSAANWNLTEAARATLLEAARATASAHSTRERNGTPWSLQPLDASQPDKLVPLSTQVYLWPNIVKTESMRSRATQGGKTNTNE